MKINIACPSTGLQKVIEIDDEKRLHNLYERRMAQEIDGAILGEEFNGYILRITGGNDKQGFPMRQGILTNTRVRLLMHKGHKGYRQRRAGERKRKSIRGCIVGHDIAVLNLAIVKVGEGTIAGLTDDSVPRRLGPKRASKIRALFNLTNKTMCANTSSRVPSPPKRARRFVVHPKSNVWSPRLHCNANVLERRPSWPVCCETRRMQRRTRSWWRSVWPSRRRLVDR